MQLAALIYRIRDPIDDFVVAVAARLSARDFRLAGLVQHNVGDCDGGCAEMVLEELASGRRIPISEARGGGASACRLDTAGLAEAGAALAAALENPVDLVIVNKFGKQEAMGEGLRDEIAVALGAGRPVLIAVREDVLDAWRAFAGDDWQPLPLDHDAAEAWALSLRRRAA